MRIGPAFWMHDLKPVIDNLSLRAPVAATVISRQAEAEIIPLEPAHIIREVLKLLRSILPTGIDIRQEIDAETDLIVADPTHIHQIVMNLCTNAFHAMEESGGTLFISLCKTTFSKEGLLEVPNVLPGNFIDHISGDDGFHHHVGWPGDARRPRYHHSNRRALAALAG